MFNREIYESGLRAACAEAADSGALRGKSVLVTGATGLIGSFLVEALAWLNDNAGAGIRIYAAGRSAERTRARFGALADAAYFHFVPFDASRPGPIDCAVDYAVHAATSAHPLAYATDPVGTMQANLLGTMRLLEALRGQGSGRFLMLSTGETYGENPGLPEGFAETDHGWIDPMNPRSCYPEGKRAAETLCASYASQYGVDALVARLCHVYGPTFTPAMSASVSAYSRMDATERRLATL